MNQGTLRMLPVLAVSLVFLIWGCGGNSSLSSPRMYGEQKDEAPEKSDSLATSDPNLTPDGELPNPAVRSRVSRTAPRRMQSAEALRTPSEDFQHEINEALADPLPVYLEQTDIDDSASAVDDEIWRQFDLAQEYHGLGVVANREASWEEAQYYFEKALKILANLDVETDSVETPEAVMYSTLLDNVVADYRVTLRSLGDLQEDVSASVLLERFMDLADNLSRDTMVVYRAEDQPVSYDIPIVMNDRVKSSIVYFQTVAREAFERYLRRSTKYAPMMKKIIKEYDLPLDLVYLSLVESGYNPHAYSWARAMGLWQFIASTGRLYGLKRDWWMDERKDPVKSTHAACRFLKDLYQEFGCWELAMAAYNGGPGRVRRTIKKQKTIDFWKMRLRRQTMDYVPLIMAAAVIAKNPAKYGFYDIEYEPPLEWDEVTINKCLEMKVVADAIGCTEKDLKTLNPELLRKYTPPKTKNYTLKVPRGAAPKLLAAYDGLPSPKETSWVRHRIRRGETVSSIAAKYGVSQYAIFEANDLGRRSTIYAGKELIVPVPLDSDYHQRGGGRKNTDYVANNSIYTVRSGDTMWDIARAFGTTVAALRRINYIERGSRIYVGQQIKIPSSAEKLAERSADDSKSTRRYASSKNAGDARGGAEGGAVVKHKVRKGDTLWDIARRYGTTTSNIRRFNGLGRSSRIYPGQELVVRGDGSTGVVFHRVKRGETLGRIARLYRTSIAKIVASNGIANPDRLAVGQKLRIYQE